MTAHSHSHKRIIYERGGHGGRGGGRGRGGRGRAGRGRAGRTGTHAYGSRAHGSRSRRTYSSRYNSSSRFRTRRAGLTMHTYNRHNLTHRSYYRRRNGTIQATQVFDYNTRALLNSYVCWSFQGEGDSQTFNNQQVLQTWEVDASLGSKRNVCRLYYIFLFLVIPFFMWLLPMTIVFCCCNFSSTRKYVLTTSALYSLQNSSAINSEEANRPNDWITLDRISRIDYAKKKLYLFFGQEYYDFQIIDADCDTPFEMNCVVNGKEVKDQILAAAVNYKNSSPAAPVVLQSSTMLTNLQQQPQSTMEPLMVAS